LPLPPAPGACSPLPPASGACSPLPPSPTACSPIPPSPTACSPLPTSPTSCLQSQSQWRKGKLLGSGTFGQVYLGFNRYHDFVMCSHYLLFDYHLGFHALVPYYIQNLYKGMGCDKLLNTRRCVYNLTHEIM
jgi:hypothetical protein